MQIIRPEPINDTNLVYSNVPETVALYNAATTYALHDLVRRESDHGIYESQVAGNIGQSLDDPTKWIRIGPTNRWAMFDDYNNTQTVNPDHIIYDIQSVGRVTGMAFLNVDAASINIAMRLAVEPIDVRNLLTWTEALDNAAWTKNAVTIEADEILSPDGATSADKVVASSATSEHSVSRNYSLTIGEVYTYSLYAKAGENEWLGLRVDRGATSAGIFVNLTDGTWINSPGWLFDNVAVVADDAEGWWRVIVTFTSDGVSGSFSHFLSPTADFSWTGNDIDGGYAWGLQLEEAATVGGYQRVQDSGDVSVPLYNTTFPMVDNSAIDNWYDWFFEPVIRHTDLVVDDLPIHYGPSISIDIENNSGDAKIGNFIMGQIRNLGGTLYGANSGIIDYSRKDADGFGNVSLVERTFRKYGTFEFIFDNSMLDEIQRILTEFRATPVVYIGSDEYNAHVFYGFYRDFSVVASGPCQSNATIEIEGLS